MTRWIAGVLGLFVLQTLLPGSFRYLLGAGGPRLWTALGPRDEQPPLGLLGGRAQRALDNMKEAVPVFLTVAILHTFQRPPSPLAAAGAAVFLIARTLYVAAYLSGVPGLRSLIWVASWVGLGLMLGTLEGMW